MISGVFFLADQDSFLQLSPELVLVLVHHLDVELLFQSILAVTFILGPGAGGVEFLLQADPCLLYNTDVYSSGYIYIFNDQ